MSVVLLAPGNGIRVSILQDLDCKKKTGPSAEIALGPDEVVKTLSFCSTEDPCAAPYLDSRNSAPALCRMRSPDCLLVGVSLDSSFVLLIGLGDDTGGGTGLSTLF